VRRRNLVIAACAVFISAVVLIAWPRGPKEPEYQGKKLSEWIEVYAKSTNDHQTEAEDAIRAIGTNSLPWLVPRIAFDVPAWQQRLMRVKVLAIPLQQAWLRREARAREAMGALLLLGHDAKAAVPPLVKVLDSNLNSSRGQRAGEALRHLLSAGVDISESFPAALRADAKIHAALMKDQSGRSWNIVIYSSMFESSPRFFEMLTNCAFSKDEFVREGALSRLSELSREAENGASEGGSRGADPRGEAAAKFLRDYSRSERKVDVQANR
jgi:hypothetical protein